MPEPGHTAEAADNTSARRAVLVIHAVRDEKGQAVDLAVRRGEVYCRPARCVAVVQPAGVVHDERLQTL